MYHEQTYEGGTDLVSIYIYRLIARKETRKHYWEADLVGVGVGSWILVFRTNTYNGLWNNLNMADDMYTLYLKNTFNCVSKKDSISLTFQAVETHFPLLALNRLPVQFIFTKYVCSK